MSLISDALKKLERERRGGFPSPPIIPGGGGGRDGSRKRVRTLAVIAVLLAIAAFVVTQMARRPAPPPPPPRTEAPQTLPPETLAQEVPPETLAPSSPAETLAAPVPPEPEEKPPQGERPKKEEEKVSVEVTVAPAPSAPSPAPRPPVKPSEVRQPAPPPVPQETGRAKEARRFFRLGQMRMRSGDLSGAVEAFRKALGLKPDYREARLNLGAALIRAGKFAEAEQELLPLVETDPSPGVLFNYALALRGLGREGEALEVVERILAAHPGYARAHLLRGELLEAEGAYPEAAQSFLEAYHADTTLHLALYRAARAFDLAREKRQALYYYRLFVSRPDQVPLPLREQVWARISYLEGLHEGPG